ncbi:MMPL family transporter [Gammaproteobacteria bacterium AH-315-M22]|nr:MMPL family transporter [Gammaproteobacteria bacterium AH-315-M22]
MLLWRSLFFIALVFIGQFFIRSYDSISIDTDLKDLSPALAHQQGLQSAIDTLSEEIERRFILLLSSTDSDQTQQASEFIIERINAIGNLTVADLNDQQSATLLKKLTLHRFQFLTARQQKDIARLDDDALVKQAQQRLFQLQGSIGLLPFSDDPMGWLNDYIVQLMGASGLQNTHSKKQKIQSANTNENRIFYQPVAITIGHGALQMSTQKILRGQLQALEKEVLDQYSVSIHRSGVFFFAADAADKAKRDISLISTASLIGVIALLLVAFRTLSALWLPLLSISLGIAGAFAVTHAWFGSVHILTILSGASLIGIVIDYSLHYFYHQNANQHNPYNSSGRNNNRQQNKRLHSALLLSLLTSIIGFGALFLSELDALKKLAVFACCGLIMAWLSVLVLGSWMLRKPVRIDQRYIPALLKLLMMPLRAIEPKIMLVFGLTIMVCFSVLAYIGIPSNDDPRLFFKPSTDLLKQEQYINKQVNNYEPGRYLIIHGENSEQVYKRFAKLESATDNNQTTTLNSVMNWLPSATQQRSNYQMQQRLFQHDGVIDKLFTLLGMPDDSATQLHSQYLNADQQLLTPTEMLALLPNTANSLWLDNNARIYSFALIPKGADTTAIETASNKIDGVEYINTVALAENTLQQQRVSAEKLLLYAYALIAILMLLRFRRMEALWMLAVPVSASMGTVIILALLGQPMNLFHTMALFLILGLGMDYVIFSREMATTSRALPHTLQAILLSALTTLLSFGLLSMSSIPVVQAFGLTVLIGNTLNLFGTLAYAQIYHANKETKNYVTQ